MAAVSRSRACRACVALVAAVAAGAVVAGAGTLASCVALTSFFAVALAFVVRRLEGRDSDQGAQQRVLHWTIAAFVVHLLLSFVIHSAIYEHSDALTYHRDAVRIVEHWESDFPAPELPQGKEGYYYLLAGVFWLFGPVNAAGLIVNAALAAALVPIVSDLTRRFFGPDAAGYVPQLVLFLPGLLLWTSQLMKEAAIILLIAVCLNAASRLVVRLSIGSLASMAAALAVLFTMRSYVGLMIAVGVIVGLVLARRSVVSGVGAALSAVALMAAFVAATGVGYSGYKEASSSNLEQANAVRKDLSTSNSGFGSDIDISTPGSALSNLPFAGATFLVGPFPWQLTSGRQLIALPDVLAWWLLLPTLWRGARTAVRRVGRAVLFLVLPALTTTALLSLVVGNFGTVVRERSQVAIMIVPILALGLAQRARRPTVRTQGRLTAGRALAATGRRTA